MKDGKREIYASGSVRDEDGQPHLRGSDFTVEWQPNFRMFFSSSWGEQRILARLARAA
jgi:hypothetical protein